MSSFSKKLSNLQVSHEYCQLDLVAAKVVEKPKVVNGQETIVKTFKEINKAKTDILRVQLLSYDAGQQLNFSMMRGGNDEDAKDPTTRILATFTMTKDFKLSMVSNNEFNRISSYTFKPLITAFSGIEANTLSGVFGQWLGTEEFFSHLKIISSEGGYTPALVKMLVLYISYQDVKQETLEQLTGQLSHGMEIDVNRVAQVFKANMAELKSDIPRMAKYYQSELMISPSTEENKAIEPAENLEATEEVEQVEPSDAVVTVNQNVSEPAVDEAIESETVDQSISEEPTTESKSAVDAPIVDITSTDTEEPST